MWSAYEQYWMTINEAYMNTIEKKAIEMTLRMHLHATHKKNRWYCCEEDYLEAANIIGTLPELFDNKLTTTKSVMDKAIEIYGFGGYAGKYGRVDEKLNYHFPDDPVQIPRGICILNEHLIICTYIASTTIAINKNDISDFLVCRFD